MIKLINPKSAPKPVGHYSTAIILDNGFLFLSGQIGIDPSTGELKGKTLNEQFTQILKNIQNILFELDYDIKNIIKVVIYIVDISKFSEMNDIYESFMGSHKPVRTTVQVSKLPKNAQVEVEITAYKSQSI